MQQMAQIHFPGVRSFRAAEYAITEPVQGTALATNVSDKKCVDS